MNKPKTPKPDLAKLEQVCPEMAKIQEELDRENVGDEWLHHMSIKNMLTEETLRSIATTILAQAEENERLKGNPNAIQREAARLLSEQRMYFVEIAVDLKNKHICKQFTIKGMGIEPYNCGYCVAIKLFLEKIGEQIGKVIADKYKLKETP